MRTKVLIHFFEVEPLEVPINCHRMAPDGVGGNWRRDIGTTLLERTAVRYAALGSRIEFRKDG